jgi:hypothetical protein
MKIINFIKKINKNFNEILKGKKNVLLCRTILA